MDAPTSTKRSAREWSPPLPEAPGFEHAMVELPGLRVHVAAIGEGRPVVMLHGFPQHWWQWRAIAPVFAAHGYRAICPDLRGSGWTEADDARFTRTAQRDDLAALLDALGLQRVHLLSHDMGAVGAAQFSYTHPERVISAVQLSVPPAFMRFTARLLPAFSHMPALLVHREGRSLRGLFSEKYVARPMTEETVDGYLRVQRRPEVSRAVGAMYRGMIVPEMMTLARGDYRRMRLRPPTLAVFGRRDGPFSEPIVEALLRDRDRCAEHVETAFVDDAAHFITDDAPDAVTALALDWFDRAA